MDNRIEIMERYLERIYDLGYDYDGCETTGDLMNLIDELTRLASLGMACNVTEPMSIDRYGNVYNILGEKIENE